MAQIVSYLIPLLDEADHVMSLTCQYCGATIGPLLVSEDGDDGIVFQVNIPHQSECPLSLAGERFVRMH